MASSAQQQQQQQPQPQQHPQPPSCKGIRINSSSHEVFQTPTNLRARCMRVFHWTEGFAKRAEAGYRQFIGLKVCHQDWDCSVLMAPPAIEKVWQQHILDVHHYREACLEFCGQLIHHNPEDDDHYDNNSHNSSVQAYKTRVQTTRRSLQEYYDTKTVDGEVWSFPVAMMADNLDNSNDSEDDDHDDDEAEDRKPRAAAKRQRTNEGAAAAAAGVASPTKRQRVAPAAASASSSSSSPKATTKPTASSTTTTTRSDPLTIFVRRYLNNINNNMEDDDGHNHNAAGQQQQQHQHHHTDLYFKLLPTTKMQKVFARFAVHYGLDPRSFVFFFGSKRVAMLDTPSSLGMIDGEMIYATQCAAVEEEEED